jgi:hypothetical protein
MTKLPATMPWGQLYTFTDKEARQWQLGQLTLAVQRFGKNWLIGTAYGKGALLGTPQELSAGMAARTYDLTYQYLYQEQKIPTLKLVPIWPDRAIVLHTKLPFYLSPDTTAQLDISIPVWCRLETPDEIILLDNLPTVLLSETWLGEDTCHGKFCYAHRPRLLQEEGELPAMWEARCPLVISNKSKNVLLADRIEWLAPYLGVYAAHNQLRSIELNIIYRDNNAMEVQFGKQDKKLTLLTSARIPHKGQLLASFIQSLTRGDS